MDQILRAFSATVDDVDNSDRSIVAKVSVGSVDRYNSMIVPRGIDLKAYIKNPIVLFEHGKDVTRGAVPIGRNMWVKLNNQGTALVAKTRFAKDDFSAALYDFYRDGTMTGWSVRLLQKEKGTAPTREEIRTIPELGTCDVVYRSTELAEYSSVSVPGNADCLSVPELRSLSTLVVRGFWTPPEEVAPLIRALDESAAESDAATEADVETVEPEAGTAVDETVSRAVEDQPEAAEPETVESATPPEAIERAGYDPSEPRDDTGEWSESGGAASEKNKNTRRKKKKLDIEYGKPDENDVAHVEHTDASRRRDKAASKLQAKYNAKPLYKSKELHDPETGRTYQFVITKNAYHLTSSEEKKFSAEMYYKKDGEDVLDDRDSFNNLAKAHKWVQHSYKMQIKGGLKPVEAKRSAPEATIERAASRPEPAAEPVVTPVVAPVVEPTPEPVDPLAGLPPLVGRSLEDVSRRNAAKVDAWADSVRAMFDEFRGWARGEG